ncbi:flagellar protein FlgN [Paenibacillus motobuensis]|uniref:flagellar protein FlgN n=1 Tax=Paenibacillus TaxID=44249 RepID=UPI00203C4BB9|nr:MULTISPECIES: flagellar protein FlgN [Paenibacillus]MCM3040943.1 flagellar protein FlgN [Paenibacillus lutimineralis]MCM3648047.1 flagellar protein FlgN [Paenibacillus motobuensis]
MSEIEVLIGSLDDLSEQYDVLLDIMQQKKAAIIANNYDDLVQVLSRESKLVKGIQSREEQIQSSAQQFLQSKGIKSRLELTITDILRLVFDPEEKRKLASSQQRINGQLEKLKQANELNQELIGQSLQFIEFSLNLMSGGFDEESTYAPPQSQEKKTSSRSNFDIRT